MPQQDSKRDLLTIYQHALRAVNGRNAVSSWLEEHPVAECSVVAVGKAAEAMLRGAADVLQQKLLSGLLITKKGHVDYHGWRGLPVEILEAAHPVPDESSLAAGRALVSFISRLPEERPLLVLISGGTSSLVEVLKPGFDLYELQQLNERMLADGKSIQEINQLRRKISNIKGGGLLDYTGNRPVTVLLISDVPGDDPSVIGSGLLHDPKRGDIEHHVIAGIDDALQAAAAEAHRLGYSVHLNQELMTGPAEEEGRRFARFLLSAGEGLYLRGGETNVELPGEAGKGGRNQHLALAAAEAIQGHDNVWVLAAGTDGTDGQTEDAGALVDGGTISRAELDGFDARRALVSADSGSLLAASGDLIQTGPTGTNVMDILIGLKRIR